MSLNTLQDLFAEQLQDLYSAEGQFAEAQPKLAEAASSKELKAGILQHVDETKVQLERLEKVAELVGVESLKGKTCQAAKGLVKEAQELLEEGGDPKVIDAGLIAALQRVEHYEMAGYGTVVAYAKQLGQDEALKLLQETLEEEKATDQKLSQLAETAINQQAA